MARRGLPSPLSPWSRSPIAIAAPPRSRRRCSAKRSGGHKRGAIYARYSSRFQHSTKDQIRECREWAEQNRIEVLDCHVYMDKRQTGRKNRAGFQAMMAAVAADEVDVVVIFTTSRLFPNFTAP